MDKKSTILNIFLNSRNVVENIVHNILILRSIALNICNYFPNHACLFVVIKSGKDTLYIRAKLFMETEESPLRAGH